MQTIEPGPRARANDPCTSHDAAEFRSASGRLCESQRVVLEALVRHGQGGIVYDELAEAAGLDATEVGRRMSELRTAGYVFVRGYPHSPERRRSRVGGSVCMVLRPVLVQPELPL